MTVETTPEGDESSFAAAFASVNGDESGAPSTPAKAEVDGTQQEGQEGGTQTGSEAGGNQAGDGSDGADQQGQAEADAAAAAQAAANGATDAAGGNAGEGGDKAADAGGGTDGGGEAGQEASQAAAEESFAGFTDKELRQLLATQAKNTGSLQGEVRRLHGKIGELNGRIKQGEAAQPKVDQAASSSGEGQEQAQAVAQAAANMGIDPAIFGDFSEENLAKGIGLVAERAQQPLLEKIAQLERLFAGGQGAQQAAAAVQQEVQQPAAQEPVQQAGAVPEDMQMQIEMGILDRMRPGWKEQVNTPDFELWVNSQDDATQKSFYEGKSADAFAGLLDKYQQKVTAEKVAVTAHQKNQTRLGRAVTPSGNGMQRQNQTIATENDSFEAAFANVLNQ